jgi:diguanylate cyclase
MFVTYNPILVALSYLIAVFASYTALDLAGRVAFSEGRARTLWFAGGATAMGIGIWSMHFTGMLASMLMISVGYDIPLVLVSLLVAITASGGALFFMSRPRVQRWHLLVGGPLVGIGIAAMHYIGMAGMRMDATISYEPVLVVLSLLIAIGAAMAALWLAFQFRIPTASNRQRWLQFGAAMVMAAAITGMHYTGMAAARFTATASHTDHTGNLDPLPLSVAIVAATLVILGFALIAVLVDRRFAVQKVALEESSQRYRSLFQHNSDAVISYDLDGTLRDANDAALQMFGFDLETLQQNGLQRLLDPETAQLLGARLDEAATGVAQNYDLMLKNGRGEELLLNMRHVPILLNGKLSGVYAIATDMSERVQATNILQQREAELQVLVKQQTQLLNTIQQLSMPVLPVYERVLVLPLIGQLNSERSAQLMEVLLHNVERQQAAVVIIDITGVPVIDTVVATHLMQATTALKLLGAEAVLVGIAPEVAQTMVQLGVNFGNLTTRSNLQAGIAYAVSRIRPVLNGHAF